MKRIIFLHCALLLLVLNACKKKSDDECPVCPSVTSISPTSGRAYTSLTISGKNFADDLRANIVKINGVQVDPDSILSGSTTQIVVKVPKTCGSGAVTVDIDADLTNTGTPPVFQYIYTYRVSTFAGKADSLGVGGTTLSTIRFARPCDILCNDNNILYIKDQSGIDLRFINLNTGVVGNISHNSGDCGSATMQSLEVDANSTFYSSVAFDNRIISFSGSVCSNLSGTGLPGADDSTLSFATFNNPSDVIINPSDPNEFYVADWGNHSVRKISKTTGRVTTLAGSSTDIVFDHDGPVATARFNTPISLLSKDGILYIADQSNHKIKKIANGIVSTLAGGVQGDADGSGSTASFNLPVKMSFDTEGNILVCDAGNFKIRKVTRNGVVTTIAGGTFGNADGDGPLAQFQTPSAICVDASGNMYVTDLNAHTIRKITRE